MSLIDDIYVTLQQTESVPIATYNQLLDANESTMIAVRDKSRAASDQMNAAAKNAGQAIRYDHVHSYFENFSFVCKSKTIHHMNDYIELGLTLAISFILHVFS